MKLMVKKLHDDPSFWEDKTSYRVCSALGYIFFFIPLVMCPESKFARYHANQSLINFILLILVATSVGFIPVVGSFLSVAVTLFCGFNTVRGFILSLKFQAARIPLVGRLKLISTENAVGAF